MEKSKEVFFLFSDKPLFDSKGKLPIPKNDVLELEVDILEIKNQELLHNAYKIICKNSSRIEEEMRNKHVYFMEVNLPLNGNKRELFYKWMFFVSSLCRADYPIIIGEEGDRLRELIQRYRKFGEPQKHLIGPNYLKE